MTSTALRRASSVGKEDAKDAEAKKTKLGIRGQGRIYRGKVMNRERKRSTLTPGGDQHECPTNRLAKLHGARKRADVEMLNGGGGGDQRLFVKLLRLVEEKEDVTDITKMVDKISA